MTEEQLREQLNAVYASTSWKLTAPLRYCSAVLRLVRSFPAFSRRILLTGMGGFLNMPPVRQSGARLVKLFPGLRNSVRRFSAAREEEAPVAALHVTPEEPSRLSPSARAIYAELQAAQRHIRR